MTIKQEIEIERARRWVKAHVAVGKWKQTSRPNDKQVEMIAQYCAIYHEQCSDPDQMLKIVESYERVAQRDAS